MSEQNKAIARRIIEDLWNRGNLNTITELYAADYVGHAPPDTMKGPAGYKDLVTKYRTAFPDIQFTIDDIFDAGDKVVIRWTIRSTHKGDLPGIPATGKRVTLTGITIGRYVGGKLAEEWTNWDALGMLQQLGAIPQSSPSRA